MKAAVLDGVPDLPVPIAVPVYDTNLFVFSQCFATPLNGFGENGKCMTPKQKWYVMLIFGFEC